jgi:hypothetical protein
MIFARRDAMQTWQTPQAEEIDMNAEIGGYEPDSPDERGDEPSFVDTLDPRARQAGR